MARIEWDESEADLLSHAVLYLESDAVPWNGLVFVDDHRELRRFQKNETQRIQLSAFTFPDEFKKCCGYILEQRRERFGLSYRSVEDGMTHLVYGCKVDDDHGDDRLFRWDISAPKIQIPGAYPSASLSLEQMPIRLAEALYGTDDCDPYLPSPTEVISLCLQ